MSSLSDNLTDYSLSILCACIQIHDAYLNFDKDLPCPGSILQNQKESFYRLKELLKPASNPLWSLGKDFYGFDDNMFYYGFLFTFVLHTYFMSKYKDCGELFLVTELRSFQKIFSSRPVVKDFKFVMDSIDTNRSKNPSWDLYNIMGLLFEGILRKKSFREITTDEIMEGKSILQLLLVAGFSQLRKEYQISEINF